MTIVKTTPRFVLDCFTAFFPAMALPHFAFNSFMAVLVYTSGVAMDRLQLLRGGFFLPRWRCYGKRRRFFAAVASPRFAVKFFMAALALTAVASPRFAVKFFMATLF